MCHSPDSRPPAPPRRGEVGERTAVTLASADGTAFSAAYAAPVAAPVAGVVILPDVRGLHPYYVALAERFAEAGLAAVAFDYFGRTAGVPADSVRGEDFAYRDHLSAVTNESVDADLATAVAYLRGRTSSTFPFLTVGFCFGGGHSWRQTGGSLDVAACVGFYGRPSAAADAAARARHPVLMLIAGADAATPVEEQMALADAMRAGGAEVQAIVYDGAPHSFFDRSFAEWTDVCADAWLHILAIADKVSSADGASHG